MNVSQHKVLYLTTQEVQKQTSTKQEDGGEKKRKRRNTGGRLEEVNREPEKGSNGNKTKH